MLDVNTASFCGSFGIQHRPNASAGLWLMFLLPSAIIISLVKYHREASTFYYEAAFLSMGFFLTGILFVFCYRKGKYFLLPVALFLSSLGLTFLGYNIEKDILHCFLCSLFSTLIYSAVYFSSLKLFPQSFTLGEAAIVSQGLILWIYITVNRISKFLLIHIRLRTRMEVSTLIIQIGLFGIGMIALITYILKIKKPIKFYLTSILLIIFYIIIPLYLLMGQNPLLWILKTVVEDGQLLKLFLYWTACVCVAILAIIRQIKGARRASTGIRKIFHILAVAVYVPGLLYNCSFLYLSSGVILGVFLFLEILRIAKIPPLSKHLEDGLLVFGDQKDAGALALTPIYLLVGCSLPLWIHPSPCDLTNSAGHKILPLLSGLITIGIGDTCASFIGSNYGRFRWTGSAKTYEGTIGCFVGQLLFIVALNNFGFLYYLKMEDYLKVGIGILVTCIVEAKTDQIDNLVLPLIMYIILVF